MTDEEKKLLKDSKFKAYLRDMEYDEIIAWKKEVPEKSINIIISAIREDSGFDISYRDKDNKSVTVFNDIDSIEDAVDACNDFLESFEQTGEDLDAVSPVFDNSPRKLAEDVDELFRSIDGEEYSNAFPDKEKQIEELEKQIKAGEIEAITQALLKFDIEEMEAELNMRNYMIARLNEYKAQIAAVVSTANIEAEIEGNYNNIDGIIGNSDSKINIKMMIASYQSQISGSSAPTQEIDELELRKNEET